jgi:hypothetical protein
MHSLLDPSLKKDIVMMLNEYTNIVLEELKRIIPTPIMVNSLNLFLNPQAFKAEYKKFQYDADKYFMHLSNTTSKEAIRKLTVEMKSADATKELELISTKILLGIQELSKLDELSDLRQSRRFIAGAPRRRW